MKSKMLKTAKKKKKKKNNHAQTDVLIDINSAVAIFSYPQKVTFLERQDID